MAGKPPFPNSPFPFPGAPGGLGGGMPGYLQPIRTGPQMMAAPPGLAPGMPRYRQALELGASRIGIPMVTVNEFLAYWAQNELAFAKKILDFKDAPEHALTLLKTFAFMRQLGLSAAEMSRVFVLAASLRSATALRIFEHIASKGPALAAKLKPLGGAAKMLAVFITAIECYNFAQTGEWGQMAGTIYKTLMGLGVPWAAAIDALQSLLPDVDGRTATALKVIRACDPIGLGAIAVDSFVLMVQSIIDWCVGRPFNDKRLDQLVGRMKKGPTSLFAELGENAGDALYDIMQMDAQDWKTVGGYTYDQLSDFLTGAGTQGARSSRGASGSW